MFKVVSERVFTHEVTVLSPADGGYEKSTIKATYLFLPADEVAKYNMSVAADTTAFLKRTVRHLDDLVDENKNPLPYSDALRDTLINMVDVRQALCRGYFEAVQKVAEGN